MSSSTIGHDPEGAYFDSYPASYTEGGMFCSEFCKVEVYGSEYQIAIFVGRERQDLLFLDQLRSAVDKAIKWARS